MAALASGRKVKKVFLTLSGGGQTQYFDHPLWGPGLCKARAVYIQANCCLGGMEAEILFGSSIKEAASYAGCDIEKWGTLKDFLGAGQRAVLVNSLLRRFWPAVEALAKKLHAQHHIDGEEAFSVATVACPALLKMYEAERA